MFPMWRFVADATIIRADSGNAEESRTTSPAMSSSLVVGVGESVDGHRLASLPTAKHLELCRYLLDSDTGLLQDPLY